MNPFWWIDYFCFLTLRGLLRQSVSKSFHVLCLVVHPCAGTARMAVCPVPVANRPCGGPTEDLRTRQPCWAIAPAACPPSVHPCLWCAIKVLHRLDEVLKSLFLNNHYLHICPIFDFGCKVTKEKAKPNYGYPIWLKVAVRWLKMAVGSRLKRPSPRKSFLSKNLLVKQVVLIPLILHL